MHVEADDDGLARVGQEDVRLADSADGLVEHSHLHLVGGDALDLG
jgi:hypothetical protein